MSILYIYGGNDNKPPINEYKSQIYLYRVGSGEIIGSNIIHINDSELLNTLATKLSENYCSYIYSLNKLFLDNNIVYNKIYSIYSNKGKQILRLILVIIP